MVWVARSDGQGDDFLSPGVYFPGASPGGGISTPPSWRGGEKSPNASMAVDDADERGSIVSMESDGSTNGPFFWYRVVSKFSPGPRNCEPPPCHAPRV